MAASGKKGKKTKGKTLALNEFLAKSDEPEPNKPWKPSWADEDVDEDFSYSRSRDKQVVLPTAPRAAREPGTIDETRIPNEAPYIAYISNLPYEVESEDIVEFFKGLEIKSLRLPRDEGREGSKLKGFGYVEFEERESLKEALHFSNKDIKGRLVGVEVADGGDDRYRRGGMGRDMRRGGMGRDMDGPDRTLGDWRSGPRDDDREGERDRGGFGFRDRGADRGSDRGGGGRRDFGAGFWDRDREGGFRERDGGGFRDREGGGFREGGFREREGGGFRDREGGGFRDREGGGFRDREGGGFRERDGAGFRERDGGGFRDREGGGFQERWGGDREMMRREGGDAARRDVGFPRKGADEKDDGGSEKDGGRARPKLNLAPRTKPPEEKKPDAPPIVSSSSIFGGAKPVDTAAREMEIEKRLAKERGTSDGIAPASSRNPDSRPRSGNEDAEEERPRKENVWVRRSQRSTDDNQRESRDTSSEKIRPANDDTLNANDSQSGSGSHSKGEESSDGSESKEHLSTGRPHSSASDRENTARMPQYVKEGPPSFVVTNKFASLPDEDPEKYETLQGEDADHSD